MQEGTRTRCPGRLGEGHHGVVVDLPERLLAAGLPDRGAEGTEGVVDRTQVADLGELHQSLHQALLQLRVTPVDRASADADHVLPGGVVQQQVQQVAADEPGGAGEQSGSPTRLLRSSGRGTGGVHERNGMTTVAELLIDSLAEYGVTTVWVWSETPEPRDRRDPARGPRRLDGVPPRGGSGVRRRQSAVPAHRAARGLHGHRRTRLRPPAQRALRREESHAPVLAICGQVPRDEMGTDYFQEVDNDVLFKDVAVYSQTVSLHSTRCRMLIEPAVNAAIRTRGVAVLTPARGRRRSRPAQGPARSGVRRHPAGGAMTAPDDVQRRRHCSTRPTR